METDQLVGTHRGKRVGASLIIAKIDQEDVRGKLLHNGSYLSADQILLRHIAECCNHRE